MDLNGQEFQAFLRNMGVELEGEGLSFEEPTITFLQRSRDHEALYRLDLVNHHPQLLVLLPNERTPLRFHFYLVQLSELHPLASLFEQIARYQGSAVFEQERSTLEDRLLYTLGETIKSLFWAGLDTTNFPPEITVQKIL